MLEKTEYSLSFRKIFEAALFGITRIPRVVSV